MTVYSIAKTRVQSQLQYLDIAGKVGMENQETSDMKGRNVYDIDVYTGLAPLDSWNVTSCTLLSSLNVNTCISWVASMCGIEQQQRDVFLLHTAMCTYHCLHPPGIRTYSARQTTPHSSCNHEEFPRSIF